MNAYQQVAQMLGVEEVKIVRRLNRTTVSIRNVDVWQATSFNQQDLEDTMDPNVEIGRRIYQLADDMRQRFSIESARGEVLDDIARTAGVQRRPEPPQKRPANRFEAIAEEPKKIP